MSDFQTDVMEFPKVDPDQLNKAATMDDAVEGIANSMAGMLSLNMSSLTSPYTLPYSALEGGDKTGLHIFVYKVTGSPAGATTIIHPAVPHYFLINNTSTHDVTFKVTGMTGVTVAAGTMTNAYCDGVDVFDVGVLSGSAGAPYDIALATPDGTVPTASQIIGRVVPARNVFFAANFAGSAGFISTNPTTNPFVITVKDNGTTIGTISIDASGVFTFATSGGVEKIVTAGHRIEFFAPSGVDATAAGIAATLFGRAS